jgi:hypothetical protein
MALVAKSGTPSLASRTPDAANRINGLKAGEDIGAGDLCYIKSDGYVWLANGTAANAAAVARGMAAGAAQAGEAITVYRNVTFHYGSGLTPGASYYVAATAGRLDTAATTGGTVEIAYAVDTTRIFVRG